MKNVDGAEVEAKWGIRGWGSEKVSNMATTSEGLTLPSDSYATQHAWTNNTANKFVQSIHEPNGLDLHPTLLSSQLLSLVNITDIPILDSRQLANNTRCIKITRHISGSPEAVQEPINRHDHSIHPCYRNIDRVTDHHTENQGTRWDRCGSDRCEGREEHDDDILTCVEGNALGGGHEDYDTGEVD
jgi:hypothetical protein